MRRRQERIIERPKSSVSLNDLRKRIMETIRECGYDWDSVVVSRYNIFPKPETLCGKCGREFTNRTKQHERWCKVYRKS